MKGASSLLTVRRVTVDDQRLKELRKRKRGGCDELLGGLRMSAQEAQEFFAPMIRQADEELARAFARHMSQAVPFWKDEISRYAQAAGPKGPDAQCAAAYGDFVDGFDGCAGKACELGPRLSLSSEGAAVAMSDAPFAVLPSKCPRRRSARLRCGGGRGRRARRGGGHARPKG